MSKDQLRAATLGANRNFTREVVQIDGNVFEVVQPTIKQRASFREAAMSIGTGEDGKGKATFNMGEFALQTVIGLTCIPGTDDRVFSQEDREAMELCPAGGWFDKLAEVAGKLCNISDDDVKKA